ncbi:NADPH-dependent FMN reductase [Salinarimonas sp.]|uniref:NADPH-dependent FMN reductase n=1 Tax=Salinarimonas sp. TaxID=2766526 RepID=UPI00391B8236
MHILVVSGSQREGSRSGAIADLIARRLAARHDAHEASVLKLEAVEIPWKERADDRAGPIAARLAAADGFVILAPEWNGMATPALKNLFMIAGNDLFAHKPAALFGVSEGTGGAYPMAELRMSVHKNTLVCFTPVSIAIRPASAFIAEGESVLAGAEPSPAWARVDHSLDVLMAYAEALGRARAAAPELLRKVYNGN